MGMLRILILIIMMYAYIKTHNGLYKNSPTTLLFRGIHS